MTSGSDPSLIGNVQSFNRRDIDGPESSYDDSKCIVHKYCIPVQHTVLNHLIKFLFSVSSVLNRFNAKSRDRIDNTRDEEIDPDDPYDAQPVYQYVIDDQ